MMRLYQNRLIQNIKNSTFTVQVYSEIHEQLSGKITEEKNNLKNENTAED